MPATEAPPHARRELLRQKPRFLRADPARGLVAAVEPDASPVERQGGVPGEGLIRGMSMVTRGEALGHYEWLDDEFIGSVVESGQAAPKGVKSRFTHPSLSGDGLGSFLGRVRSARLSADGRKAIGDLHLSRAAHRSPDGDLGGYVMDLAVEDPEAFAVSIVYEPDYEAEEQHALEHGAFRDEDEWGPFLNFRDFTSPDPDNVKDLPHARLKRLFAADVVDDPAANPDGLFHREQQVAEDAEAVMSYALGLTDRSPEGVAFDVHPERVRGFVNRFMEARGLRIVKESVVSEPDETTTTETEEPAGTKPALDSPSRGRQGPEGQSAATAEQPAADQPAEEGSPNAVSRVWGPQPKTDPPAGGEPAVEPAEEQPAASDEKPAQPSSEGEGQGEPAGDPVEQALDVARQGQARGECARFVEAFGDQGGRWFAEGMTFEQARQTYAEGQAEELKRLRTENEQLKRRLEAARGEAEPVEFEPDDPKAARAKRLAEKIGGNLGRVAAGMTLPTSEKPIA